MARIHVGLVVAAFATLAGGMVPADKRLGEAAAVLQDDAGAGEALAGVAKIRSDAKALEGMVSTDVGRGFLAAADALPEVKSRTLYRDPSTRKWMSKAEADALPAEQREKLTSMEADADVYYNTKYGSPLAYVRAMDILGKNGVESLAGQRVLDFGYGTVGHLRLMAANGAQVTGVDVDPFLTALYSEPEDQGEVQHFKATGSVTLVNGRFPADEATAKTVGGGYDIIISKNTLKRGYVNPPADKLEQIDKRMLIDLGVDDEAFLDSLRDALKPGGLLLIYNLSPKMPGPEEKYMPMCDGRCPWEKAVLEAHGFEVVAYDMTDDAGARAMGHALGWDAANDDGSAGMDLENDLFSHYTVLRRARH